MKAQNVPFFEALESRALLSVNAIALPNNTQGALIHQAEALAKYPWADGRNESIVIIDVGVDYNHPALGGGFGGSHKVVDGFDFIKNTADPIPKANSGLSSPDNHGTFMAGIAASSGYDFNGQHYVGVAPNANLIALRTGSLPAQVQAALQWVVSHRLRYNIVAVNLMGTGVSGYRRELRQLDDAGVFVGSPASNIFSASTPLNVDPAAVSPHLYFTGASDNFNSIVTTSQRGPYLDFLAPGDQIVGPSYDPSTGSETIESLGGAYTSPTSPQIVGAAAVIKNIDPAFTPDTIADILTRSGDPIFDPNSGLTYHRLNLLAAMDAAIQLTVLSPNRAMGPWPRSGTPFSVSSAITIQAEDFDSGGEGLAYHKPTPADIGPYTYRHSSMGIFSDSNAQGGATIGGMETGEWVSYSVQVPVAGNYLIQPRLSTNGGQIRVQIGSRILKGIKLKSTGMAYAVVNAGMANLQSGNQILKVYIDRSSGSAMKLDSVTLSKR